MGRSPFVLVGLLFALSAGAHHGWSEYDSAKVLNVTGVIKEAGYEHPHGQVTGEVELAIVIRDRTYRIPPETAHDHILGVVHLAAECELLA